MKKFILPVLLLITLSAQSQNFYSSVRRKFIAIEKEVSDSNYIEALKIAAETDKLFVDNEETENEEYAIVKRILAYIFFEMDSLKAAEKNYIEAIDLFREYSVSGDVYFVESLNEYSILLLEQKRYSEAESLLIEALDQYSVSESQKSPEYASTLTNLGMLNYETGNYIDAEKRFTEALQLKRLGKGGFKSDVPYTLHSLADCYSATERYTEATKNYREAINEYRKIGADEDPECLSAMADLAATYIIMSQFSMAEPVLRKVLETEKKTRGINTEDYAYYLSLLADFFEETGEYREAEKLYNDVLDIQSTGGFSKSDTYFSLASLYTIMADFASAEELALRVIAEEETEGKNSSDYTSALNLLANIYTLTGNYEKAEELYLKILEIDKTLSGNETAGYAIGLDNLANLYLRKEEYEKALLLVNEALSIKKRKFGEFSKETAYSYNSLSTISLNHSDYNEAEKYSRRVSEIYEKCLGSEHSDYAGSLMDIARIYLIERKFSEAEPLLMKSAQILKNRMGANHPWYNNCLSNLADLFDNTGRADSAKTLYLRVNENLKYQIERNFSYLAEKEKEAFISTVDDDFEVFNSFAFRHYSDYPELAGTVFDNQLALKGIVLNSSKSLRLSVLNSGDKSMLDTYNEMIRSKSLLLQQEQMKEQERILNTDSLENITRTFEKELSRKLRQLPGFSGLAGFDHRYRWEEISDSLGDEEIAIEFISFDKNDRIDTSYVNIYCGLLLRKGMKHPELISLFEEDELISFLDKNKSPNDATTADNIYKAFKPGSGRTAEGTGRDLYAIIWKPLEKYLQNVKTVYYSPCKILNRISFDAIPLNATEYLSDRYKLVALLSTRELINRSEEQFPVASGTSTVFFGGIDYDSDTLKMKSNWIEPGNRGDIDRSGFLNSDGFRGSSFVYLDGTLSEVRKISNLFSEKKVPVEVLTGDVASEEKFKSFNNLKSPVCLHIATHGFFFPEPLNSGPAPGLRSSGEKNVFHSSQNPLFRSGLIFAGGNHAWKNQSLPAGIEDGILLASEVSEMYLPNTRLVVLSACETGLGEIKGSEGVFGLQRAFKMAGVDNLILSLWQVPDYQTSELMTKFYENWISGLSLSDSFRNAQEFMKRKYQGSPSSWAAFVLLR